MSLTRRKIFYASILAVIATVGVFGVVYAASLLQTPNIGSGKPSLNRSIACSQTTVYCYSAGGGSDAASRDDTVSRYNRSTDTVDTVANLPVDNAFIDYLAHGTDDGRILFQGSYGPFDTGNLYVYTEGTDTWQTISPSVIDCSFGCTGTLGGDFFYVFYIQGGTAFAVARIDVDNLAGNYSLIGTDIVIGASRSPQQAKSVFDPDENKILIFTSQSGDMVEYDIATNTFEAVAASGRFPPCLAIANCIPSVAFWDNDLGVLAGQQGAPSSTTIGLSQYDWSTQTWSALYVETLSDAQFNDPQFTQSTFYQPMEGYSVNANGETEVFFGSSKTPTATPGYDGIFYWLRTGDPGGLNPFSNDFDSWLDNWLNSMGMNSPFGRLLVGTLFAMFIFIFLANKGVPWIISLGLTGLAATFLTAAMVFDPAILLVMVSIVMAGGFFLIFSMILGGDKGNG